MGQCTLFHRGDAFSRADAYAGIGAGQTKGNRRHHDGDRQLTGLHAESIDTLLAFQFLMITPVVVVVMSV